MAVGSRGRGRYFGALPFTEYWNGDQWMSFDAPKPEGADFATLTGVSCPSVISCLAVGVSRTGECCDEIRHLVVERWDGVKWSLETVPDPATTPGPLTAAVSCPSATYCMIVGTTGTAFYTDTSAFATTWDGVAWTAVPAPNQRGSGLLDVSCTAADTCAAVGGGGGSDVYNGLPLAAAWDGTSWTTEAVALPDDNLGAGTLSAVSCSQSFRCVAVGGYGTDYGELPLIEQRHGEHWEPQKAPGAKRAFDNYLNAVSCTPDRCVAVGYSYEPTTNPNRDLDIQLLIEVLDGTKWKVEPSPLKVLYSALYGVSCVDRLVCRAVGDYAKHPEKSGTRALILRRRGGI